MIERSVVHDTFVVERTYDVPPASVFAAWADPAIKGRWFGGGEEGGEFTLDFRVGGREINRGGPPDGPVFTYEAHYHDIVPDQRIVYTYDLRADETLMSVSLTTVELTPAGAGTRMVVTEHGAYLDGHDTPDARSQGTGQMLDGLAAAMQRGTESA